MENITGAPCLKKLFIQLNTPLPASAAAEHLLSCCGLTMNSRRTRLNDELFEDLVMLRVNKLMCNAIYDVAYSVSNTAETYFLT